MNTRLFGVFCFLTVCILSISFFFSHNRMVWTLEVFPILVGFPILVVTYGRFTFTRLLYSLLIIHFIILSIGGIYTYAKVPLGFWMEDWFGFTRNHYDRIGHFVQGFVPALLTREILIRTSPLKAGKWLSFIVVSICLAVSALYELIEWAAAAFQGSSADAFLGTQGDEWDAQKDMFMCLIGAIAAVLFVSKLHDRFLRNEIKQSPGTKKGSIL
jgi:putative membrane protein